MPSSCPSAAPPPKAGWATGRTSSPQIPPPSLHADAEPGSRVPAPPIAPGALVEAPPQVKETYPPAWNRARAEQVSCSRKKPVAQLGHVLGPPVIVTARGFRVVEK